MPWSGELHFEGPLLCEVPYPVAKKVRLLPIPDEREELQVAVILGPKSACANYPQARESPTTLLGEGPVSNDLHVWIVYLIKPATEQGDRVLTGRGHASPELDQHDGQLRAVACSVQHDGCLAFWEGRVMYETGPAVKA